MVKQIKKNPHAYTLIELIVVVAIIILFSAMLSAQYNTYTEQSRLRSEAQNLANAMETARKKSVAYELTSSCAAGDFGGYNISFGEDKNLSTNANKYFFSICCAGSCTASSNILQEYSFAKTTISFYRIELGTSQESLPYSITFYNAQPYTSLLSSTLTITLKNSMIPGNLQCTQLTVSPLGVVTIVKNASGQDLIACP